MFFVSEWYWRCVIQGYLLRTAAIVSVILSAAVVWSEVTFFNKDPVLSIFAKFLKMARTHYDYLTIEVSIYTFVSMFFVNVGYVFIYLFV